MKNINFLKKSIFALIFAVTFVACDEGGDPDPGGSNVQDMAGDWYVQFNDQGDEPSGDYYLITTYNTAADDGKEIWIDDNKNIWWFKAKAPVQIEKLSFAGTDLASSVPDGDTTYDIKISVANGKIVMGGAITDAGNPSDSISFDIEFEDDPGNVYSLVGYRRTGFLEDEH